MAWCTILLGVPNHRDTGLSMQTHAERLEYHLSRSLWSVWVAKVRQPYIPFSALAAVKDSIWASPLWTPHGIFFNAYLSHYGGATLPYGSVVSHSVLPPLTVNLNCVLSDLSRFDYHFCNTLKHINTFTITQFYSMLCLQEIAPMDEARWGRSPPCPACSTAPVYDRKTPRHLSYTI